MKKTNLLVTGSAGLLGKSLMYFTKNHLKNSSYNFFFTNKKNLDLSNYKKLSYFLKKNKIKVIINTAASTGGILRNRNNLGEMLEQNTIINFNIIKASYINKIKTLIFLGSSCIYPRNSKIPIKETEMLSSFLEPTNEGYALAKITASKLCQYYNNKYNTDFRCIMPCNLIGPGDKYDTTNGHVIPSLVKKFCDAKFYKKKKVEIWGSGKIYREFLDVRDLSKVIFKILKVSQEKYARITNKDYLLNIGVNKQYKINNIVKIIATIVNFKGRIIFNNKYPDGVYSKKVCTKRLDKMINFKKNYSFKESLVACINDYEKNRSI
jgi:GDP-L-fucose synthase